MSDEPPPRDEIVLRDYPVLLGAEQAERHADLLRELQLLTIGERRHDAAHQVPVRLLEISHTVTSRFGDLLHGAQRERDRALAEGRDRVDIRYPVVDGAAHIVSIWAGIMEEVDEYCAADELLTLATPPDLQLLRRWTVGQFLTQIAGGSPSPWPGPWRR